MSEFRFIVNMCDIGNYYYEKPEGRFINSYVWSRDKEVSITEFAELIGRGQWFHPGLYNGRYLKENVKEARILGLDYDGVDLTPTEAIDLLAQQGFPTPNIWHYSFSHGIKTPTKNRFRLLWILDKPLDKPTFDAYEKLLFKMGRRDGDTADKQCLTATRAWHGTNKHLEVLSTEPVSTDNILSNFSVSVKDITEPEKFGDCQKDEEAFYDGDVVMVSSNWEQDLYDNCGLFRAYHDAIYENHMEYNGRAWLLSDLKYIRCKDHNRSIKKRIKELYHEHIDVWRDHTLCDKQIDMLFSKAKGTMKAYPIPFDDGFFYTIPEWFKMRQAGDLSFYKARAKQPLPDKEILDKMNRDILNEHGIVYYVGQTGLGKTTHILKWALENIGHGKKVVLAEPTYNNIAQVVADARALEGQPIEFSNVYGLTAREYDEEDEIYMYLGLSAKSKSDNEDRKTFLDYLRNPRLGGLFVVTHAFLLNYPLEIPNVIKYIIDENIEGALTCKIETSIDSLKRIMEYTPDPTRFNNMFKDMIDDEFNARRDIKAFGAYIRSGFYIDKYIKENKNCLQPSLFKLIMSDEIIKHKKTGAKGSGDYFTFYKTNLFDGKTDIILATATPMPGLMDIFFPEVRYKVEEIPLYQNAGTITTFNGITGARGDNREGKSEQLNRRIMMARQLINSGEHPADTWVIPFLDEVEYWEEAGFKVKRINDKPIHIMNCAGLNCFKGENVIVAGKYDVPSSVYDDIYLYLHPEATALPTRGRESVKSALGMYRIFCYKDAMLQAYQLQNINYALKQCAGRARTLREDCRVAIIGDYPIDDSDYFKKIPLEV